MVACSIDVIPVSARSLFHQHHFDRPHATAGVARNWCWIWSGRLSEIEICWEQAVISERTNPEQEGLSRSKKNIDVRGRPVQQKLGRAGRKIGGRHQRCSSQMILGHLDQHLLSEGAQQSRGWSRRPCPPGMLCATAFRSAVSIPC
jgi:hypothetical protein